MANGQMLAAANVAKFKAWVVERITAGDWSNYIRQGQLNRTEVAAECGFAKSVLRQNPAVKKKLERLERRLRCTGILPHGNQAKTDRSSSEAALEVVEHRVMVNHSQTERRVKALEERNAALLAQVRELEARLRNYRHIDEHLGHTGRLLPSD